MADPVSLLPVVVGGLLTMAGGVIGSGVTVVLKLVESRNDRKKRRAEKFEALVELVYEHDHWLENKRNALIRGGEVKIYVSPIAKIEAISAVYFPGFNEAVSKLAKTTIDFEVWILAAALKERDQKPVAEILEGNAEASDPYQKARDYLLNELKEFAHEEFQ